MNHVLTTEPALPGLPERIANTTLVTHKYGSVGACQALGSWLNAVAKEKYPLCRDSLNDVLPFDPLYDFLRRQCEKLTVEHLRPYIAYIADRQLAKNFAGNQSGYDEASAKNELKYDEAGCAQFIAQFRAWANVSGADVLQCFLERAAINEVILLCPNESFFWRLLDDIIEFPVGAWRLRQNAVKLRNQFHFSCWQKFGKLVPLQELHLLIHQHGEQHEQTDKLMRTLTSAEYAYCVAAGVVVIGEVEGMHSKKHMTAQLNPLFLTTWQR